MQVEEIKALLESGLEACEVDVVVEGSHVSVTIIGDIFQGLRAVRRQQLVYAVLNDAIASGVIHAVNMKLFTVAEWQQSNA
ncbi:MAG: BolA/IbaG family iron-sulfur metabolism protein [Pseudomonadales bacterium]